MERSRLEAEEDEVLALEGARARAAQELERASSAEEIALVRAEEAAQADLADALEIDAALIATLETAEDVVLAARCYGDSYSERCADEMDCTYPRPGGGVMENRIVSERCPDEMDCTHSRPGVG